MGNNNITVELIEDVAVLTINRPDVLNALNRKTLEQMDQFLVDLSAERSITTLIVTGAGNKAFIAGADISEMQQMNNKQIEEFISLGQKVTLELERAPYVTIAAVNGYALGAGLEMALSCDLICAAKGAKLGLPEIELGLIPGFGGTQRLIKLVGKAVAMEMILTAKPITAEMASSLGVINEVYEPEILMKECKRLAMRISSFSRPSIYSAKRSMNSGKIEEGLELEKQQFLLCFDTQERRERMQAFIDQHKK